MTHGDPIFVALAFHHMTEIDWPLCGGSGEFVSYALTRSTVQSYPAEKIAVNRQNVDNGSVMPIIAPALIVNWLPNVTGKTIFEV